MSPETTSSYIFKIVFGFSLGFAREMVLNVFLFQMSPHSAKHSRRGQHYMNKCFLCRERMASYSENHTKCIHTKCEQNVGRYDVRNVQWLHY